MINEFEKRSHDILKAIYDYGKAHNNKDVDQEEIARGFGVTLDEIDDHLKLLAHDRCINRYWTTGGSPTYVGLLPEGRRRVMNGFNPVPASPQVHAGSVGNLILQMQGGNVQGIGQVTNSQISQFAHDPRLLAQQFDGWAKEMREIVRDELADDEQAQYAQLLDDLRDELLKDRGNPSAIRHILGGLTLMSDIEGSLTLIARLIPYIVMFISIASAKYG